MEGIEPIKANDLIDMEAVKPAFERMSKNLKELQHRWQQVKKAADEAKESWEELNELLKGRNT